MHVLLDTNVILDLLLARQPWVEEALPMWEAHDAKRLTATVSASVITDIYYVSWKLTDRARARRGIRLCLAAFQVAAVDRTLLDSAFALAGGDFEDDVQIAMAGRDSLDAIVTRDSSGFTHSPIPVWTPAECARRLT